MNKSFIIGGLLCLSTIPCYADSLVAGIKYAKGYNNIHIRDIGYGYYTESDPIDGRGDSKVQGLNMIGFEVGYDWKHIGVFADHNISYKNDSEPVSYTTTYMNMSLHTDNMDEKTFIFGNIGIGMASSDDFKDDQPSLPAFKAEFGIGTTVFDNIVLQPFIAFQYFGFKQDATTTTQIGNDPDNPDAPIYGEVDASAEHSYFATNIGLKMTVRF